MTFLTPLEKTSDDLSMEEIEKKSRQSASGRLAFRADVVGRAYVHSRANVGLALQVGNNCNFHFSFPLQLNKRDVRRIIRVSVPDYSHCVSKINCENRSWGTLSSKKKKKKNRYQNLLVTRECYRVLFLRHSKMI